MSKLVLLRHGESVWNKKNVFTGWVDVPLSLNGIAEAEKAGAELANYDFDLAYTSLQIRAIETAMITLIQNKKGKTPVIIHQKGEMQAWSKIYSEEMQKQIIPVYRYWQLNERYYGELQGHNKVKTAEKFGKVQVHQWRRSYDISPPKGECLKQTAERTIPFFKENIFEQLQAGKDILVSAHGNSLRSIVMFLEKLNKEEVLKLEIQTGEPIVYEFEEGELRRV